MVAPFGEYMCQTIQTFGMFDPVPGQCIELGYTLWKPEMSR